MLKRLDSLGGIPTAHRNSLFNDDFLALHDIHATL